MVGCAASEFGQATTNIDQSRWQWDATPEQQQREQNEKERAAQAARRLAGGVAGAYNDNRSALASAASNNMDKLGFAAWAGRRAAGVICVAVGMGGS